MSTNNEPRIKELQDQLKSLTDEKKSSKCNSDVNKRKINFVRSVEELFANIKIWLNNIEAKKITEDDITIIEKNDIQYITKKLSIQIGRVNLFFKPIGFRIIGGNGRIDIIREYSQHATLILLPPSLNKKSSQNVDVEKDKWFFANRAKNDFAECNEENFLKFLINSMENDNVGSR